MKSNEDMKHSADTGLRTSLPSNFLWCVTVKQDLVILQEVHFPSHVNITFSQVFEPIKSTEIREAKYNTKTKATNVTSVA